MSNYEFRMSKHGISSFLFLKNDRVKRFQPSIFEIPCSIFDIFILFKAQYSIIPLFQPQTDSDVFLAKL